MKSLMEDGVKCLGKICSYPKDFSGAKIQDTKFMDTDTSAGEFKPTLLILFTSPVTYPQCTCILQSLIFL